ncbi:MAG: protein translocase subunit SecF [Elusimicrobiota bacterium]
MRLLHNVKFDFLGKRYKFITLSAILIAACALGLIIRGLNLGIDFKGGIVVEIQFDKPVSLSELRDLFSGAGIGSYELQSVPKRNSVILRAKGQLAQSETITGRIKEMLDKSGVVYNVLKTEYVGPRIGKHLSRMAYLAILFSFLGIIVYVAIRFKSGIWGVAGVLALVHDVFITVGLFAIFGLEVDLTVVAALLTLAGYSINDTIVIFDRIRENLVLLRKESFGEILNTSICQTLSRTIITSFCTELVVLTIFLFGGEVIHNFSLALLFGMITGTYSTIFIASPIVYEWMMFKKSRV